MKTLTKARFQRLTESWFAMKDEFKGKYVPPYYYDLLELWSLIVDLDEGLLSKKYYSGEL